MNLRQKKNGFDIILAQCYKFVWKVANILDFFTYLSPFQIVKEVTLPTKLVDQINEIPLKSTENGSIAHQVLLILFFDTP